MEKLCVRAVKGKKTVRSALVCSRNEDDLDTAAEASLNSRHGHNERMKETQFEKRKIRLQYDSNNAIHSKERQVEQKEISKEYTKH